jgi:DNA-binding CsgD family transcriptional regulator/tetratricopeptide (TPR) repeat protein
MGEGRARSGRGALIERETELRQIGAGLRSASSGDGGVLLIEGPAGIGKTSLLTEAERRARTAGMQTIRARGDELEGHFPYGVVRQLLEPVLRDAAPETRADLLAGAASAAGRLLVVGRVPTDRESPAAGALALTHALYWLTVNLSLTAPTLLVVDDAHLADAASLRFLRYLTGRLDGVALLTALSVRSGEPGPAPELIAQLASDPEVHLLTPRPLSERGIERLLKVGLGRAPEPELTTAAHAATGGTPFLAHELVAALASDGIEPDLALAAHVGTVGPQSIARTTMVRLRNLPEGCATLAQAIAVLAAAAQLPLAASLANLGEHQALQALDALVAANVVRPGASLGFVHPIVRAAIYQQLPPGERSRLHRAAAELLIQQGAELDTVAAQLLPSEPTGSHELVAHLREAATAAFERGAPEDAVAYLSRALSEGGSRHGRAELLFELGTAAKLAGQQSMVEHFAEARRMSSDPLLRARAALELATALAFTGQPDASLTIIEEALLELGDLAPDLSLRFERMRAGATAYDPRLVDGFDRRLPGLLELTERSGEAARPLTMLLAAVLAWRGESADTVVSMVERGWDEGRLLSTAGDDWTVSQGLAALVDVERPERAWEITEVLLASARESGSVVRYAVAAVYRGWIEARRGDLTAAEGELRAALAPALEQRLNFVLPTLLFFASDVLIERSQAADLAALAESFEIGPMAGGGNAALMLDVRARLRQSQGQVTAATADMRAAGQIYQALGFENPSITSWRSALALMIAPTEPDNALRLVTDELAAARRIGHPRAIGIALRTLGLLRGGTSGLECLEQSVDVLASSTAKLEHARGLVELGAAMRRGGQRTRSRGALSAGLELAVIGGAERLAERARTELAASGAKPRRLRLSGRDSLTPSELRVARLGAEGYTNNEIAQALFITPKTVDTHLSHVYGKLGISSRRDLSAALSQPADQLAGPPR